MKQITSNTLVVLQQAPAKRINIYFQNERTQVQLHPKTRYFELAVGFQIISHYGLDF